MPRVGYALSIALALSACDSATKAKLEAELAQAREDLQRAREEAQALTERANAAALTAAKAPAAEAPASEPAPVAALADVPQRVKGDQARVWLLARGQNAFLGKLELAPGGRVPEHRDPTEEYIHILEGSGTFTIDGRQHAVGPGSTIYMRPDALVEFVNGSERLVAIQVFAGPGPAAKYDAWDPAP